jgi:hypothetical protein
MRRHPTALSLLSALVFGLLLVAGGPLAGQGKGQDKKDKPEKKEKKAPKAKASADYYPLKVGSTWEYRVGKQKATVRVLREETMDNDTVAVLETTLDGKKITERVGVKADGVYRYSGEGVDYKPPLRFLKLPPEDGETWEVKSQGAGLEIAGTFKAGEEEVTVAAGQYEAVTSSCAEFRIDSARLSMKYWFVPRIGMVKQQLKIGDREVLIELEKYTPAK